jgi:hypothetical protein
MQHSRETFWAAVEVRWKGAHEWVVRWQRQQGVDVCEEEREEGAIGTPPGNAAGNEDECAVKPTCGK